jgi:hypothetical protein
MAALAGKMKVNGPGVFFLIALNTAFYDQRIRKALGYEQFTTIDDDIDLLYLKACAKQTFKN